MALKKTSSTITIGFSATESGANTFTESKIDLQLNPLDNEVFVVQAVNLDPNEPEAIQAVDTAVECSVTSTSTTLRPANLSSSGCIVNARHSIRSANNTSAVAFEQHSMDAPPTVLPYLAIISTNDFFVQILGTNNTAIKSVFGKMYGYRAKADSATYAALVQSEILSS